MENLYSQQTICQELSNTNTDKERKPKTNGLKKKKKADQSDLRPVKTLSGRFCICLKILKASLGQSTV